MSPYDNIYGLQLPTGVVEVERYQFNKASTKTKRYIVMEGENIQSIAYKHYGDSGYWGIIADMNGIHDPFEEVVMGIELLIPIL